MHPGLLLEAAQQGMEGVGKAFLADLGAEVEQQLPHVLVAFLHPGADEVQVFLHLFRFPGGQGGFQHLHLEIKEGEGLGDAVVEPLGHEVALFGDGELPVPGRQAQVFDGYPQVLAQGFDQVLVLGR